MKPARAYALALGTSELQHWLGLAQLKAANRRIALSALREYGTPSRLFDQLSATSSPATDAHAPAVSLGARFGTLFAKRLAELPLATLRRAAEEALAWQEADPANRHIVTLADPAYPSRLLEAADPPMMLFVHGRLELLARPSIAVVGSRKPSQQGRENAYAFSRALAQAGWTIVSGLAQGIDARAHQAALDALSAVEAVEAVEAAEVLDAAEREHDAASGARRIGSQTLASTIAVIGTGIDVVYPYEHRSLSAAIAGSGAVVSEWPLGTPARAAHFPQRNRLIAALSHGVLIVEATLRSGSLITARIANDIGRDVFAIPGSIHAPQSRGCHALIKEGAKLVDSIADVLDELRPDASPPASSNIQSGRTRRPQRASAVPVSESPCQRARQRQPPPPTTARPPPGDANARHVLDLLGHDPVTADILAARGGWDAATLIGALTRLEIGGWIEQQAGRYTRTAG